MKKRLLFTCIILLSIITIYVIQDASCVSKKEYQELSKNHPIRENLKLSKQERKKLGIPPNKYFDRQYLLEMDPKTGKTHPENLLEIKKQLQKPSTFFSKVPGQSQEMSWVERGPDNIAGRTRVVFYDPNDTTNKRVFAGGVSGGLWVNNNIEDENSLWTQVGIDENLAVSCYAIDPNDSNIWYIGTGEAYTGDDGVGNGIWITTNGGSTWSKYLSIDLDQDIALRPYVITQILAWDNNGKTEVFYSVDGKFDYEFIGFQRIGWWKIENSNTSRVTFLSDGNSPYVFSDVEVAKDNSIWVATKRNIYGDGGGKIFRSTDGLNFTEKYSFSNSSRVELTISKQDENKVYVLASTNNGTRVELVKTTDGNNFSAISKPNDVDTSISANDFARRQGFYNLTLEIDPLNDDILYAGGIDLFKSTNGGSSWSQISKWSNNNNLGDLNVSLVHADQHAVLINPLNTNKGLFANDGGVFYCDNLSLSSTQDNIVSRNKNYNITQFYSADISQNVNDEFLLGGTQDNGSLYGGVEFIEGGNGRFLTKDGVNSFVDIFGGDGIQNFIDKDSKYVIVSYTNNVYSLYNLPIEVLDGGTEIVSDQNTGTFANNADLDDNLEILFTDGSSYAGDGSLSGRPKIFRFSNLLSSALKTSLSSAKFIEAPTVIKVSPYTTNASTIFIGTEGPTVLKVTNANTNSPTWEIITTENQINLGSVSDIEFGENEDQILVTLHNYGVNNIYYTDDGGDNWQEKEGDLPDIPVKAIQMNPLDSKEVIIGTNMGVWATTNFMDKTPVWVQSYNGMSSVKVTKFEIRTADNTVVASTYGRGLFTGKFEQNEVIIEEPKDEEPGAENNDDIEVSGIVNNGILNFNVNTNNLESFKVTIYNTNGKLVKEELVKIGVNQSQIDVTGLLSGVYILNTISNGDLNSTKIIINN